MIEKNLQQDSLLKKTELSLKNVINIVLKGSKQPQRISKPMMIFSPENISKILILRQDRIGDVLVTIPTLRILKKAIPDCTIDICLSHRNVGVSPSLEPYIDNIIVYKNDIKSVISIKKILRRRKYDLVIDPFDNVSTTSSMLIKMSKAKKSLGIDKENRKIYDYTVPLLDKNKYHIVDRIAQILLPFGIDPSEQKKYLEYKLSNEDKKNAKKLLGEKTKSVRMGVILSGSTEAKFWGITNNVNFINTINERYEQIEFLVFGTKDIESKLDIIADKTQAHIAPFVDSVHEFAALLSTCDIILTPDTSSVHFASAFGIPAIALYKVVQGHSAGSPWTPYGTSFRMIATTKESLKNIKISEVVNASEELFEEMELII